MTLKDLISSLTTLIANHDKDDLGNLFDMEVLIDNSSDISMVLEINSVSLKCEFMPHEYAKPMSAIVLSGYELAPIDLEDDDG